MLHVSTNLLPVFFGRYINQCCRIISKPELGILRFAGISSSYARAYPAFEEPVFLPPIPLEDLELILRPLSTLSASEAMEIAKLEGLETGYHQVIIARATKDKTPFCDAWRLEGINVRMIPPVKEGVDPTFNRQAFSQIYIEKRAKNRTPAGLAYMELCGLDTIGLIGAGLAIDAKSLEPLNMELYCPTCNTRHVDLDEWATTHHRTHQCAACGTEWTPYLFPTFGTITEEEILEDQIRNGKR